MFPFFKPKKKHISNEQENLYQWKYLDVSEVDNFPNAIEDIYEKRYDGMIIRNVLSTEEVKRMKERIEAMDTATMIPTGVGFSYPKHFAQLVRPMHKEVVSEQTFSDYFNECSQLGNTFQEKLGIDIQARIESIFSKLVKGKEVAIPKGYDGKGQYAFGAIRMNLANKGFISVHCGNYFQVEFSSIYQHLMTEVEVEDQLSYFITINPAEEGGELVLFDLLWEKGQTKEHPGDDSGVILANGDKLLINDESELKRQKIKPGAGDLLIFSGGPIWHKVSLTKGKQNRITFGGFLALTSDQKTLKYWT